MQPITLERNVGTQHVMAMASAPFAVSKANAADRDTNIREMVATESTAVQILICVP